MLDRDLRRIFSNVTLESVKIPKDLKMVFCFHKTRNTIVAGKNLKIIIFSKNRKTPELVWLFRLPDIISA